MSAHLRTVMMSGRALLRRLEEARRDGDEDQVRALRGRVLETRRAMAQMTEELDQDLEEARRLLRELEGEEAQAA